MKSKIEKPYAFNKHIEPDELETFQWVWKSRGKNWANFFNQYGMNKITKNDFVNLMNIVLDSSCYDFNASAGAEAYEGIQSGNFYAEDKLTTAKGRAKKTVFSNIVKKNYNNKCAICTISTKDFLIGSHIIPWAQRKDTRLDPTNGICLCSLDDKAFDKGFITINDDYTIKLSDSINNDPILKSLLLPLKSQKIRIPQKDIPNKKYLKYHRDEVFKK